MLLNVLWLGDCYVSKITESARGEVCQLRLDSCDSGIDGEKVVFCHADGGGMGLKSQVNGFHFGFYSCLNCHDLYDGRKQASPPYDLDGLRNKGYEATIKTQKIMAKEGII